MPAHDVFMGATNAHAFLGNHSVFHTFRFNPDTVQWNFLENTQSFDTIGGRVVQLLSVQIQGMTVNGRAGSRGELQRLADNIRSIMEYHVKTSQPVQFRVPSRKWDFLVYVAAMPQVGWDVAATSYPYSLQLMVEEDVTGFQSKKMEQSALTRLAKGIGYQKDFHGGSAGNFQKIVTTVLNASGGKNTSGATSGFSSGDSIDTSGYANPLRDIKNLQPYRIDEGVDYAGSGPVYAIGPGKVIGSIGGDSSYRTTWPPWVSYILTAGSKKGLAVYVAESIIPRVKVGQTVDANTVVATMTGGGIETGWAVTSGVDWALAHSIYHEGDVTPQGQDFSHFMERLGAPGGV